MEKDFNNNYMPQFNDYGMPPPNIGMDMNELCLTLWLNTNKLIVTIVICACKWNIK